MAKNKSADAAVLRPKTFGSSDEIGQSMEKLRRRIVQVEELKKDGLPYRDALKVTTEYQIRDTIREIFGEHSPEFHEHQHYRIKVSSKAGVDETITLLQTFVAALEDQQRDLLGLRSHPTMTQPSDANGMESPQSIPAGSAPSEAHPTQPAPQPHGTSAPHNEDSAPDSGIIPPAAPSVPVAPAPHPNAAPKVHETERATASSSHMSSSRKARLTSEPRTKDLHVSTPVSTPASHPTAPAAISLISTPPHAPRESTVHQPAATAPHMDLPSSTSEPPAGSGPATHSIAPAIISVDQNGESGTLAVIRRACLRFHSVVRQLRQRSEDRVTLEVEDEIDIQDVLRAILCVQFEEIHAESWHPDDSGGTRIDLMLPQAGVVIVVKKTKQGMGVKTLTEQLSMDLQRYLSHPHYKTLVFFIYDPEGRIGNPSALEATFARRQPDRHVEVVIAPK